MALNPKQLSFIKSYLISKNATQAAKDAGYSEATAQEQGSRLLSHVMVKAKIQFGLAKQEQDLNKKAALLGVTKERMIRELSRIAFADMDDFAEVTARGGIRIKSTKERKPGLGRVIKKLSESTSQHGGSIGLELHSKDRAKELLCKILGWTKEQLELTGKDGGPIETTKETREDRQKRLAANLEKLKLINGE